MTFGQEGQQRAVAAAEIDQRDRPVERTDLQELGKAQLLGRRILPIHAARTGAVAGELVGIVGLDAAAYAHQRGAGKRT